MAAAPDGPFTCRWEHCAQECADMATFVEHVNNDHVAVSHDFLCLWSDCERRKPFSAHYQLIIHVRDHTGHKPFTCS
ncbi:transformer-1, partial [Aphelenchoides avenae]